MGISLNSCADEDLDHVPEGLTASRQAEHLVSVAEDLERKQYGIPIANKRVSVTNQRKLRHVPRRKT